MVELLEKLATEMSEYLKRCMAFFYAREWKLSLLEIPASYSENIKAANVAEMAEYDDVKNATLEMNLNLKLYSTSREPYHSKQQKCNLHRWWWWRQWCHYHQQWWWSNSWSRWRFCTALVMNFNFAHDCLARVKPPIQQQSQPNWLHT